MLTIGSYEDVHVPYLMSWEYERRLGNSGITWRTYGEIPPARLPTIEQLQPSFVVQRHETLKMELASVKASASGLIRVIDTFDRPADAYAEEKYARSGTYATKGTDKPGQRIPKIGAYAEAGVGRARAQVSVFEAEAKGPNASAGAEASVLGVGAMARAELVSASASAGPVTAKIGLGVDTGASAGLDGVQLKFLGTGFSIGPKTSITFLGSELSFEL